MIFGEEGEIKTLPPSSSHEAKGSLELYGNQLQGTLSSDKRSRTECYTTEACSQPTEESIGYEKRELLIQVLFHQPVIYQFSI